jgi:hypothetical protein
MEPPAEPHADPPPGSVPLPRNPGGGLRRHEKSETLAPPPVGTLREEPGEQLLDLIRPQPSTRAVAGDGQGAGKWRRIFGLGDPRELLALLAEHDPFDLRARGIRYLQHQALALHADRLHVRLLAQVAYRGALHRVRSAMDDWLSARVAESALQLVREDVEAEVRRALLPEESVVAYAFLVESFGVEPPLARRLGARFNMQSVEVRRVLWGAVLEGRPLEELGADAETILRTGLESLGRAHPIGLAELAVFEKHVGEDSE